MYSASQKCPPLSRCSTSRSRKNQMWCTMHKLATPQELARLHGPQIHGTTGGSTPVSPQKPKRYALQIWLEVEVGPGVYLDRAGHMLAFYGRKGGSKAGLIQDVAIEAGRAVTEIPTWMGLTARWKVRCVSLAEANDILAGCKRLEKEN